MKQVKPDLIINKLEAARRQLDTAIRLKFANEDDLAVHTITAAAFRILRDITQKRGRSHLRETIRAGIYFMAHRQIAGSLLLTEIETLKDLKLFGLVCKVADDIRLKGDSFSRDEIPVPIDDASERTHWKEVSKAANFLKHADKNPTDFIALGTIDTDALLVGACSAYANLMHATTPEMDVFYAFWSLMDESPGKATGRHEKIAAAISRARKSDRYRTCLRLIAELKNSLP